MRGRKPSIPSAPRPLPNSGDEIEVYWAGDRRYYPGKIGNFDPNTNTFRVEYIDGDVENLDLNTERWRMRDENPNYQRSQEEQQSNKSNNLPLSTRRTESISPARPSLATRSMTSTSPNKPAPTPSEPSPSTQGPEATTTATNKVPPKPTVTSEASKSVDPIAVPSPVAMPIAAPSVSLIHATQVQPQPKTSSALPQTATNNSSSHVMKNNSNPSAPNRANTVVPYLKPNAAAHHPNASPPKQTHVENSTPASNTAATATPDAPNRIEMRSSSARPRTATPSMEIDVVIPSAPPVHVPPKSPARLVPLPTATATRPARVEPQNMTGKKRKLPADIEEDVVAAGAPTSSSLKNNTILPSAPGTTAVVSLPRTRNNGSVSALQSRSTFPPPTAKRIRPLPTQDKRVRQISGPEPMPSVGLMARYAADAAKIVAKKETEPVTKEMENVRATMRQWTKDHEGIADKLHGFARKQDVVMQASTSAARNCGKVVGIDILLENKLSKYFSEQAKRNEELVNRITTLEEELKKSNAKLKEHMSKANGSVAAPTTAIGVDTALSANLIEQTRLISNHVKKELEEIKGVTESVTGEKLQREITKLFNHVVEPRIRDLIAQHVMTNGTTAQVVGGDDGQGNTVADARAVATIAETLVSRSATIWLLEDTERSPPPQTQGDLEAWRRDCCTRCLKSVANSLRNFDSADTALRVLRAASQENITFAWFYEPGVESNVQLARTNYNAWDPPLTDEEWEAEAGVLRELARRYAVAQNRNRMLNCDNQLQIAVATTQAAVDNE